MKHLAYLMWHCVKWLYILRFIVTFAFAFHRHDLDNTLLLKMDAGVTMCRASLGYSSINFSSYIEQDFLGILCISGSCFSSTPTSGHAEHQSIIS